MIILCIAIAALLLIAWVNIRAYRRVLTPKEREQFEQEMRDLQP